MLSRPRYGRVLALGLVLLGAGATALPAAPPPVADALHAWAGGDDPAALEAWVHYHMQRADTAVARLLALKGARTVANTLRPYDDAVNELTFATAQSSVLYGVVATSSLQDKITELGLKFERAVHDDVRTVVVDKEQLTGLPPDYLAAHPPDAQGQVKITTDPPDAWPARRFADNGELRHKLFLASQSVAYPANTETLRGLLQARADLAQLLGYATWADFAMADQMIGSPAKLHDFLASVDEASREAAKREDAALLAFARTRDASLQNISAADASYWREQYRRARFSFDSQSVRPYFPYAAVERGVIATAARLFHVDIRAVPGVHTWHPSVTTYDVYDGDRKLGRIYLDMHPREGKDKWFSTQPLAAGVLPGQLPEGTLVCNFTGGVAADPGLMQYGDVVIFLHEFGHLMHHVIGGQQPYAGEGGFNVEGDFVEAPSQMLEEFFHDYEVLATFARHYQTGAVLPRELYERMNPADTYGRASGQQLQLMYSAISLDFHTLPPAT